ncbi:MAG: ABC-2 transporter permease [Lachnospiraceae bacterium]|nr:ABC-2 transporter permease [Lachnospiraceae bacterium]
MKGLLIKDFELAFLSRTTFPLFLLIATVLLFTGNAESITFVVAYFTILCGMMLLGTMSYDEADNSGAYLMTLPITRKTYVREKYVLLSLGVLAGWAISVGMGLLFSFFRRYTIPVTELVGGSLLTVCVIYILLIVMLPIQLKYGNEKSRIVMIVFAAVIMIALFAGKSIAEFLHIDTKAILGQLEAMFAYAGVTGLGCVAAAALLVTTGISYLISVGIMQKKQY